MIAIVDYGVGNLMSIQNMLKKAGVKAIISGQPQELDQASKLILPGMGAFDNCMAKIQVGGLRDIVHKKVVEEKVPVLGICVGLQMFMAKSEEGNLPGLDWIGGKNVLFNKNLMGGRRVPNMGWLDVEITKTSPLGEGLNEARFYFAHSYHIALTDKSCELMVANYGYRFTAAVEFDNMIGVQFHPEKSHRFGLKLFRNFVDNY